MDVIMNMYMVIIMNMVIIMSMMERMQAHGAHAA